MQAAGTNWIQACGVSRVVRWMTSNPYLKRLLGEAVDGDLTSQQEMPPPRRPDTADDREEIIDQEDIGDQPERTGPPLTAAPATADLVTQWRNGDQIGVASRLMFTEASYRDFVDLLFQLGHEEGRVLGQMLDELADSENINPPETPPEYLDALRSASTGKNQDKVL